MEKKQLSEHANGGLGPSVTPSLSKMFTQKKESRAASERVTTSNAYASPRGQKENTFSPSSVTGAAPSPAARSPLQRTFTLRSKKPSATGVLMLKFPDSNRASLKGRINFLRATPTDPKGPKSVNTFKTLDQANCPSELKITTVPSSVAVEEEKAGPDAGVRTEASSPRFVMFSKLRNKR